MSERLKKAVADPEHRFTVQRNDNKIDNPKKGRGVLGGENIV